MLKITGTTSSNEFDTTTDQGVAFVVNPRGTTPVYVPLTYSYNAEYNTAQYTGTYTVTELGVTAKIGGLTNFNVIDYGTNGQPVLPYYPYDMIKGAYDGFTIEGDYKVGDVLTIFVVFDSDWYATLLINVQAGGTTPTPDPTPTPTPTPGGEVTPPTPTPTEFDVTTDQGVAFVVSPNSASPVYVPLTYSYNAEYNIAQYTGEYTVTEYGFTAKIGGLTNLEIINYGTNGEVLTPYYVYTPTKGASEGFTIAGDYKVGDILKIFVTLSSDWYADVVINVIPTLAPTENDITLYYVNVNDWSTVYGYVWPTGGVGLLEWPGSPATKIDKTVDGYDVYSYTFDATQADNIIFNNGGYGSQTDDLAVVASKPYYYNDVWYETLTFDATGSDEGSDEGGNEGGNEGGEEGGEEGGDQGGDDTGDVEIGEPANLYIIGALTDWVADATWQFSTADDEYFVLSFPKGQEQELSGQFKVASSNWSPYNFGAPKDLGSVEAGKEYVLEYNVVTNLSITDIIKVSKIEFILSTQTLKITGATEEKVFDTTSDYGFYLYADYKDYPFTFKGNGVYEYDYTGVGPSSTIGDYQYKTVEWGRNSTGNEVTLGELYQLALANSRISFPDAATGQTLTIVLTVSSDWSATILVKEKSSEEGGDEGGNEGGEEGGGDTPVVPGPTPEPEPVVAIRELTLQPFERILPKTSTTTVATFILENASTATVSLGGNDADFFEIGEQNIAEGECSVQLVFNPFVKGVYYATLTVTTDDNVSLSIDFAAVCGDETFEPGDVPELNPDPVNPETPEDNPNVSVEEVSAVVIYANEGTIYSEVDFEIYDLAGVNVTSLNGALKGVYVVKTTEGNRLISVW